MKTRTGLQVRFASVSMLLGALMLLLAQLRVARLPVAEGAWLRRPVSDELSPGSARNSSPCAGVTGVVWVTKQPYALAFWDGSEAQYLTPLPPWGGYSPMDEPSLWGDKVAYTFSSSSSCTTSILYWDGQGSHRVSYQSCPNGHPSLFAGRIAWDDYPRACWPLPCEPEDSEIWFWNGYGAWQVTDNEVDDRYPSLYELTIAWESEGNVVYATIRNPELGVPPTPTVVAEGERPALFKNQIAYYASDGNDAEIFLYDIESAQTLQVTDNDYHDFNPRLYDGTMVWEAYDGNDAEIFYWDGTSIQQLTDNDIPDTDPTLWGTGLDTTIAWVETSLEPPVTLLERIICLRPAVTVSRQEGSGGVTLTWPSLEGRAYRVEYSDNLVNWKVAAESVPSAGYGETSWTDGPASGTTPAPSEVRQRFYRVCETE